MAYRSLQSRSFQKIIQPLSLLLCFSFPKINCWRFPLLFLMALSNKPSGLAWWRCLFMPQVNWTVSLICLQNNARASSSAFSGRGTRTDTVYSFAVSNLFQSLWLLHLDYCVFFSDINDAFHWTLAKALMSSSLKSTLLGLLMTVCVCVWERERERERESKLANVSIFTSH